MSSGRYYVVVNGRKFCVEPIRERNQKENDLAFSNGGLDGSSTKNGPSSGGAILEKDSEITPENGYTNITTLPPGVSPMDWIEQQLMN